MPLDKFSQTGIGKRDATIEGAFKVFSEHGFQETKMEHNAKAADVGKGTLYLYFSNKDEIMQEMLKKVFKYHLDHLIELMELEDDPL